MVLSLSKKWKLICISFVSLNRVLIFVLMNFVVKVHEIYGVHQHSIQQVSSTEDLSCKVALRFSPLFAAGECLVLFLQRFKYVLV